MGHQRWHGHLGGDAGATRCVRHDPGEAADLSRGGRSRGSGTRLEASLTNPEPTLRSETLIPYSLRSPPLEVSARVPARVVHDSRQHFVVCSPYRESPTPGVRLGIKGGFCDHLAAGGVGVGVVFFVRGGAWGWHWGAAGARRVQ